MLSDSLKVPTEKRYSTPAMASKLSVERFDEPQPPSSFLAISVRLAAFSPT